MHTFNAGDTMQIHGEVVHGLSIEVYPVSEVMKVRALMTNERRIVNERVRGWAC